MQTSYEQTDGQGNAVGTATLTGNGTTWNLDSITINPEDRGHGYASQLLEQVRNDADSDGVTITLTVDSVEPSSMGNRTLCKWFGRNGWNSDEENLYYMTRQPVL